MGPKRVGLCERSETGGVDVAIEVMDGALY